MPSNLFSTLGVPVSETRRLMQENFDKLLYLVYTTETQVQNDGNWYYFNADPTASTGSGAWDKKVWIYKLDVWISDSSGDLQPMGTGYFDYRVFDREVTSATDTRDKRLVEYLGDVGDDYDEVDSSVDFQCTFINVDEEAKLPFAVRVQPEVITPFDRGYVTVRAQGIILV